MLVEFEIPPPALRFLEIFSNHAQVFPFDTSLIFFLCEPSVNHGITHVFSPILDISLNIEMLRTLEWGLFETTNSAQVQTFQSLLIH